MLMSPYGVDQLTVYRLIFLFVLVLLLPPRSTLFPYTTLFRSMVGILPRLTHGLPAEGRAGVMAELQALAVREAVAAGGSDRKSTRLNSSHVANSYAVFCLKKKTHLATVRRAQPRTLHGSPDDD